MEELGYIDLDELTQRVGVSRRTIRDWIKCPRNPLPAIKPHGKYLFKWHEVERWLDSHRVTPINLEEITNEIIALLASDVKQVSKKDKK